MRRAISLLLVSCAVASVARAQDVNTGGVAKSSVGKAGERQTQDQQIAGIQPLDRIDSRIANRVQSRIRNRIDRYYNPQANATSPFEDAATAEKKVDRALRR